MSTERLQWHHAIPGELISSNEVHVWRVLTDTTNFQSESFVGILSADELTRAEKFHFERDQKKFIMARGILRKILSNYLGMKPQQLRFEYTSNGKPVLATNSVCDNLSFNLSHSGSIVLYAVTRNRKIGIDVELIKDNVDVEQIAQRFFSSGEINLLDKIHNKNRREVFFQYWTRKEAFIKATGEGVSFPMEQVDVSLISEIFFSPIILPNENSESSCWHMQDLFPGDGYAAAIAVEGSGLDISSWHFSL